jgi:hypothetical protein
MPILSPHRVPARGKVVKFEIGFNLGRNIGRLKLLENKMYSLLSTLQRGHDVLLFMVFGCVLREELRPQIRGGSDAGNSRLGL